MTTKPYEAAVIVKVNARYLEDPDNDPVVVPETPPDRLRLFDYGQGAAEAGIRVEAELLFIASQKGTGKTEFLARRVGNLLRQGIRVLLIGNRRTLLAALAGRLGLTNYLCEDMRSYNFPSQGYAVCLDSIGRITPGIHDYDIVIVDECQGVFSHLRATTLADERKKIMDFMRYHFRRAEQVVLLDADLGKLTLDVIAEITHDQDRSSKFVINDWKPTESEIYLYEDRRSPRQAIGDLMAALEQGRRCYVCCNSKTDAQLLFAELPRRVKHRHVKAICVTGDNSKEADIQRFIRNIARDILDYDLVIVSPAVASGIDITFPNGEKLIDEVFGIMRPLVTTHFEIDQQIARVRHPGRVRVWISDEEFLFESDPEVIRAEIWASEAEHHVWLGTTDDGKPLYHPDALNDTVFVAVTAQERASKNALRKNYVTYKEAKGWKVAWIPFDADTAGIGAMVLKEGKDAQRAAGIAAMLGARKLNATEYGHLRLSEKVGALESSDEIALRRYELESFYRCEVTEDVFEFDEAGRGRRAVRNMEALLATPQDAAARDAREVRTLKADRHQWVLRREVLSNLLTASGLYGIGGFRMDATVDLAALGRFISALEAENAKATLQRLFQLVPRKDHARKPVRQLTELMKLIGVRLVKDSRDRKAGADRVSFKIDPASLERVLEHVVRRKKMADPSDGEESDLPP